MKFDYRLTLAASTCLMAAGICAAQPTYRATPIQAAGTNFNRLEWLSDDGTRAFGETGIVLEDGSRTQPCIQYKDGAFTNLPHRTSHAPASGATTAAPSPEHCWERIRPAAFRLFYIRTILSPWWHR